MRDLASVVTVAKTWPLEGKDKVQGASFRENGYEVMIGKDVQVGDLMVFIQEGAILPEIPHWEFLRKKCYKADANGFLIKPMKFASIKSWGLACNLDDMKELLNVKKLKSGQDVTDLLNIRKYEPAEDASPVKIKIPRLIEFCKDKKYLHFIYIIWKKLFYKKGPSEEFPDWLIAKSDETTIQNCPQILEEHQEDHVYVTHKLEGQSFTVLLDPKSKKHDLMVCSRNRRITDKDSSFMKAAISNNIESKLRNLLKTTGKFYIFQGEQCGPEIQHNIYKLKETRWYVYTVKVYDPETKDCVQLSYDDMCDVCSKLLLLQVPIISDRIPLKQIATTIDEMVEYASKNYWKVTKDGKLVFHCTTNEGDKLWKNYAMSEGVVVRSMNYDKSKNIGFSFKVKNFEYSEKGLGSIAAIKFE